MIAISYLASFAGTVSMNNLARNNTQTEVKIMGSLTFFEAVVALCSEIKIPLPFHRVILENQKT